MKSLILACLLIVCIFSCCSQRRVKLTPEYTGVDPRAQHIIDEFMWLSAQNDIGFNRKVTVGFKTINNGDVVGLCTYGGLFREIDIDLSYWNHSTYTTKMTALFHELTHCYCRRGHDYGANLNYPESESARLFRALRWKVEGGERPGYWDDGCPVSIMYPVVLDDDCMHRHYNHYTKEMFDRCRPW